MENIQHYNEHMRLHRQERHEDNEFKKMVMEKIDRVLENQKLELVKTEQLKLEQFKFCKDTQKKIKDSINLVIDDKILSENKDIKEDVVKQGLDISELKEKLGLLFSKVTRYEMYILAFVTLVGYIKYSQYIK